LLIRDKAIEMAREQGSNNFMESRNWLEGKVRNRSKRNGNLKALNWQNLIDIGSGT
jgi:hypothetical protein